LRANALAAAIPSGGVIPITGKSMKLLKCLAKRVGRRDDEEGKRE
jgi:hypothetical protein